MCIGSDNVKALTIWNPPESSKKINYQAKRGYQGQNHGGEVGISTERRTNKEWFHKSVLSDFTKFEKGRSTELEAWKLHHVKGYICHDYQCIPSIKLHNRHWIHWLVTGWMRIKTTRFYDLIVCWKPYTENVLVEKTKVSLPLVKDWIGGKKVFC